MSVLTGSGVEAIGNEIFDADCMKLMNEYFYGVRVFPGQDPTHVYVGWVTSQYHLHTKEFNLSRVRKASVAITDDYERLVEQWVSVFLYHRIFAKSITIAILKKQHYNVAELTDKVVIWSERMNCTTKSLKMHRAKVHLRVCSSDASSIPPQVGYPSPAKGKKRVTSSRWNQTRSFSLRSSSRPLAKRFCKLNSAGLQRHFHYQPPCCRIPNDT